MAALDGSEYPMPSPIRVNGTAATITAPTAARNAGAEMVAAVNSAAISTTGRSETVIITRPARIRPANRGPGPAGSVRV
jgi:hypothetical protein